MLQHQKGDIIVFKAEDDWLSKAIAALTDSDVSHAAMVYSKNSIVEVGAGGIGVNKTNIKKGDTVYVMRMKGNPDSKPLIACADRYLSSGVHYDFEGLILLAGLLFYKKIPYSSRIFSVSQRILTSAAWKLDGYINQLKKQKNVPAMVCSQLVYQIYKDCGEKYRILIDNGTFSPKNSIDSESDGITLASLVINNSAALDTPLFDSSADTKPADDYALAKELYEALTEVKTDPDFEHMTDTGAIYSNPVLNNLMYHANHFLSKLNTFLKKAHMPVSPASLFVTPADLAHHAVNLNKEGTLYLERV